MSSRILLLILCAQPLVQGLTKSTKKGVAHWADNFLCDDFDVMDNVNWWYDWRCNLGYFQDNNICSSVIDNYKSNYVSMIWGFYHNTDYTCPTSETAYLLGPNEPNHEAQCNLSPGIAAERWMLMQEENPDKLLVSPSAAKCGSGCNTADEYEWFDEFFELCVGCRVDYLATHTYKCNAANIMLYLEDLYTRYNRSIWLTEFACRSGKEWKRTPDKELEYMQQLLPLLEQAPYVYRYAWYMGRILPVYDNISYIGSYASLFEPDTSELTMIGQFYNAYEYWN